MIDVVNHADVLAQLEEILDGRHKVRRIQGAVVERRVQTHLDVELQAAHTAEIVFARIEKHSAAKIGGRFERRGVAWTQLAINLDQSFFRGADGVLVQSTGKDQSDVVALREENIHFSDAGFGKRLPEVSGQRLVGFEQDFAGLAIDDVGDAVSAFEIGERRANLRNFGLDQFLEEVVGDALVRADNHFFGFRIANFVSELAIDDTGRNVPVHFLVAQGNAFHLVKGAKNIFVGLHAQRAQENRAQEFALAVDAHVQNVLGVVFEFHPGAAVRNNLAEEVGAVVGAFKKDAGRAVQLADDHALGAIDDEGAVLGHQRNVAVENFLFLDVANSFRPSVGVLVVNGEANGDFEWRGISHPAFLAFIHVVLQLHSYWIAALVAKGWRVLVKRSALVADNIASLVRIGDY